MSFAEGILWFLSTFVSCWGATLIVRGLRGEGIRKKWGKSKGEKRKIQFRPTWKLVLLGLGALASGLAAGWFTGEVHKDLSLTGGGLPITPWQIGSAGVLVFGVILLTHAAIGDRSRERKRCPRCWYDLSGLSFGEDGAVCSECGRKFEEPSELGRSRRSKRVIVVAAMVVVLGSLGVSKVLEFDRPAQLVPRRVLAWWLFADGKSPQWVRDEINERSGSYSFFGTGTTSTIGPTLWRAWIDELDETDSIVTTPVDLRALTAGFMSMQGEDFGKPIPLGQLNAGWQTQGQQLLAMLCSEDPSERSIAAESIGSFRMLMTISLMNHPEMPVQKNPNYIPEPAEHFAELEISDDLDTELRSMLVRDPSIIVTLEILLGWRAYERFSAELLAIRSDPNSGNREVNTAASIFGSAALNSAEARDELAQMLEGENESLVWYALCALRVNALFDYQAVTNDRQLASLLRLSTDSTGATQQLATRLLFFAAANDLSRIEPLIVDAMTDPAEAQRLIEVSERTYMGLLIPVRDALFERLSESPVTEVRLVLASAEQPFIDMNGTIRPALEKLAADEDEEVAAAAKESLRNLQDLKDEDGHVPG